MDLKLEHFPFNDANESDVRGEILDPLLRALGYRFGTRHNIIREQSLRYPRMSLGRKNVKRDPILRGKADYILEADGRLRWILEAKPPAKPICADDVDQAWTYANHPEVRAIYFVLCNGRHLEIYRTTDGPQVPPALSIEYSELQQTFAVVFNVLAPEALCRDFPDTMPDTGKPIAPGLRSVARIAAGAISYGGSTLQHPAFEELQVTICGGAIERNDAGGLVAFVKTSVPSRTWQLSNERLGLSTFEMTCGDSELSRDETLPNAFVYEREVFLAAGETLFDLDKWQPLRLPVNVHVIIRSAAIGTYVDHVFCGTFETSLTSDIVNVRMVGSFVANLS